MPNFKREDTDINLSLEMLVLSHLWTMSDAQRALQDNIIKMKMVDPFNLDNGKFYGISNYSPICGRLLFSQSVLRLSKRSPWTWSSTVTLMKQGIRQ